MNFLNGKNLSFCAQQILIYWDKNRKFSAEWWLCEVHSDSDCPHRAPQAVVTCCCVTRCMHRFTCTSQKVLPGQLTVDVARILPGLATPTCTTQPQRHPGPTSATTAGWSAGRDGDGDSKQLQDSDPTPQLSVCRDGPWNSPCTAVPAVTELPARFVTTLISTAVRSHIFTPTQKLSTSDLNFNPRYFVLYFIIICVPVQFQQNRQCTYNVTMKRVSVTIVAVEKL